MEHETKWLIELSDNEPMVVTGTELEQMEHDAEEFDGFYCWRVIRKLTEVETLNFKENANTN